MRRTSLMLGLLALIFGLWAASARSEPVQQMVELKASDGRPVPALITYPEGGPDTGAPIAIFHHGGPGGHPLRALGAARWGADYFARRGYITVSLLSRISRDLIDQPFGAGVADIKGAIDWSSQLSSGPIVLVGHSSGSVSNTLYMAQTQDPRVKAIVHFSPTGGGADWMTRSMGAARYTAVVARLTALVAQGRGDQPIYEDHHLAPPAPPCFTYGYLMSAKSWLSWWGPDSLDRNLALFPKIRVPMLMITGDADIFVSRQYQAELRRAATASPRVDSITLEGGVPHEFTGAETKAAALAYDWLEDVGFRPLPRITTRVVDLKIGSDMRPGVIYQPTDAALGKPMAVMLLADFTDDVMLSPLDALGPKLAKAGYTVLFPEDRGGGWSHYRAVAGDVASDQQAWLKYLTDQGYDRVAVIAHGWGGLLTPSFLKSQSAEALAGVALIQPTTSPVQFAKGRLGADEYAKAVEQANAAVQRGDGGTKMIIAPYETNAHPPAPHAWLMHMAKGFLSYWGPSAPDEPVAALAAAGRPILLIDADRGGFLDRSAEAKLADRPGVTSKWYRDLATPFDTPDKLSADLVAWLGGLKGRPSAVSPVQPVGAGAK